MNVHFPGRHEDGLEADPLLAGISLGSDLGALSHIAYCREVLLGEAVFVAFDDNACWMNLKGDVWLDALSLCSSVVVVIGVLEKLKDQSSTARVEVSGKPDCQNIMLAD